MNKSMMTPPRLQRSNLYSLLFFFAIPISGCAETNVPPPSVMVTDTATKPAAASNDTIFERFDVKDGTFELGLAPCTAEGCTFLVRWQKTNQPMATIMLPNLAPSNAIQKGVSDFTMGTESNISAWTYSDDGYFLTTIARPIKLDSTTTGLLVTQHFGWEHIKRLHRLIVPRNGTLETRWEFDESAGPTWSAALVEKSSSTEQLALFWHVDNDSIVSEPDHVSVTRLKWDSVKQTLEAELGKPVATALFISDFRSAKEARHFKKSTANSCILPYWVLSSNVIATLQKGHVTLGKVFMLNDVESIEAEKKRLSACHIKLKFSSADIRSTPLPYEMR